MSFKIDTDGEITIIHSLRENRITLDGVELEDILVDVSNDEIIKVVGVGELLDSIGKSEVMSHFNLKEDDNG